MINRGLPELSLFEEATVQDEMGEYDGRIFETIDHTR
jgi:hypothetical protein